MSRFYLLYAIRSLLRGGQRSLLALVCIAFAVLSLVSMQLLASMVRDAVMVSGREQLGGDVRIARLEGMHRGDLERLERLKAAGSITGYTSFAHNNRLTMVKRVDNGRVFFLSRAYGIDRHSYPLAGDVILREPDGARVRDLLAEPGSVIVTRDVASRMDLTVGDQLQLGGPDGSKPTILRVAGIASLLANRRGDAVIYDLATARQIAGRDDVIDAISIATENPAAVQRAADWQFSNAADVKPDSAGRLFDFMLKGAGLLGLLIGGIGVGNTLAVTLARRTPEIAILKSVGYRKRDLLALLGLETALLALVGAILGGIAAIGVATQLMKLLDSTEGALMLVQRIDALTVITGIAAGIVTCLVFGTFATLRASGVRPATLLRQGAVTTSRESRVTLLLGGLIAAAVFAVLGSAIMGSIARGVGVIAAGIAALLVLGAAFGLLLILIVRLPMPTPLLNMARRNLQHQRGRAIIAVIALFIGAFTVGFAGATLLSARERVLARRGSDDGLNLRVHAPIASESMLLRSLEGKGAQAHSGYAFRAQAAIKRLPSATFSQFEARHTPWNLHFTEGSWSVQDNSAYLPEIARRTPWKAVVGDTLIAKNEQREHKFVVAGFYKFQEEGWSSGALPVIVHASSATALASEPSLTVTAAVPEARLREVTSAVSAELPSALVLSKADFNDLLVRSYSSLFTFVAAMAGLAFLAGAVLIANAVGLALVERKREIGILKAIGYAPRHVLTGILLENALLGALAGLAGIAAVRAVAAFTNAKLTDEAIRLGGSTALGLFVVSVGIALVAASLVAWRPAQVRPLTVLRQE